jgi:Zn-dependent protease with chaperone function/Zn-finger nucleic acid-binding protein
LGPLRTIFLAEPTVFEYDSENIMGKAPRDFYEIQKSQRAKSLLLFGAVLAFHFIALGLIGLAFVLTFGFLLAGGIVHAPHFWTRFLLFDLAVAGLVAVLHFLDASRNGPRYILKRLQAEVPDVSDRYHKQFLDTLDEIRIAAGLPRVNGYVLPSFAINSLALIEADRTPAVAVTEGLLADCTRDELQAVAAHELAHIARGDAFYLTLVCSLANIFEKLREALEPESDDFRTVFEGGSGRAAAGAARGLLYAAVYLSSLVMHLLSMLISRERELLADAAAVELCRSPESLARAIYKAQIKNSFIGDFSLTYTPLFIVPPDARDVPDNLAGKVFNSHPPFMKRLGALAAMAHKTPGEIIMDVKSSEKAREQARGVTHSFEEIKKRQLELFPGFADGPGPIPGPAASPPVASETALLPTSAPGLPPDEARIWLILSNLPGRWEGPFTTAELICHPRFSAVIVVKNSQEGVEGRAREFSQIKIALGNLARKKPLEPARGNLCPRCRVPLVETYYEGVSVRACRQCTGKLVDMSGVGRIIARREVTFSDDLTAKARAFRERVRLNPVKKQKINTSVTEEIPCPACGYRMVPRPYSYQYFVPVEKCLSCSKIWFDADELEILQILIEDRGA